MLRLNNHEEATRMNIKAQVLRRAVFRSHVVKTLMLLASLGATLAPATAATPYPGGVWEPGPPRYGSTLVNNVAVPMDDGVVLRGSVAYPTDLATGQRAAGTFPVILELTPYAVPVNTYFTERGYISVRMHSRGTGQGALDNSDGVVEFFSPREAGRDGRAVVEWAAKLEGADGRVGMFGCSWPGGIALGAAAHVGRDSPLKAVVSYCIGLDSLADETFLTAGFGTQTVNLLPHLPAAMGNFPSQHAFFQDLVNDITSGGDRAYVRGWWKQRAPLEWASRIVRNDVPVLLAVGWRDIVTASAFHTYAAFQNASQGRSIERPMTVSQPTTPRYQLIVGNWIHGGGRDFGVYLQWFETWLKGVDTGIGTTRTPMHLYEYGTDRWVNVATYPAVARYTSWYLQDSGELKPDAAHTSGGDWVIWGPTSQPGTRQVYTTPPFPSGATLSGPVSATIYATSTHENLELVPVLFDVAPDGTATEITHGAVLGSQRHLDHVKSWTDDSGTIVRPWTTRVADNPLNPGRVYRYDINLVPKQWGLRPGHSVRLELRTQADQAACAAPNTRTDPCIAPAPQMSGLAGSSFRILRGPTWPSALNLPQLPALAFPTASSGVTPTSNGVAMPLDWGPSQR
jgi:predicted acyl esterase